MQTPMDFRVAQRVFRDHVGAGTRLVAIATFALTTACSAKSDQPALGDSATGVAVGASTSAAATDSGGMAGMDHSTMGNMAA